MQQRISAEGIEHITIDQIEGNFTARGWDEEGIVLSWNGRLDDPHSEGNALMLGRCEGNLEIQVPDQVALRVRVIHGNGLVRQVQSVNIEKTGGNLQLDELEGETYIGYVGGQLAIKDGGSLFVQNHVGGQVSAVDLEQLEVISVGGHADIHDIKTVVFGSIGGHLDSADVQQLNAGTIGGHVNIHDLEKISVGTIGGHLKGRDIEQFEASAVGGNCDLHDIASAKLGNIGGYCVAHDVTALSSLGVGADCRFEGSGDSTLELAYVGRDLKVTDAGRVQVGNVGHNCELRDIAGAVTIGSIGNDVSASDIEEELTLGHIGNNAFFKDLHGTLDVKAIDGDFTLEGDFPEEVKSRIHIGKNARIELPDEGDITVTAMVGGSVKGRGVVSNAHSNVTLVYGEGTTRLDLLVGGNLELKGDDEPRTSSSRSYNWDDFGREMNSVWSNFGEQWHTMGTGVASSFAQAANSFGAGIANMAEEQKRRAEEMRRRAEEQAQQARERAPRVNVRFNNREWRMDVDHINRIVEQAQKATADGIVGAMEAVEQALKNVHVNMPPPPVPPVPPTGEPGLPPIPPMPPMPPMGPSPSAGGTFVFHVKAPGVPPTSPGESGQSTETASENVEAGQREQRVEPASTISREQEREAILRMVAEGRITPEEGDMLLEAL